MLELGRMLRQKASELGLTVPGPAPAPIPLIRGQRRAHCLVKGQDWSLIRSLFSHASEAARQSVLRLRLDLDPLSML